MVGHSYNQCDRNFGLYSKKKKDIESIETVEEYVNLIKNSRDPGFIVVQDNEYEILDYEKNFPTLPLKVQKEIKISQKKRLLYKPNGDVFTFNSYDNVSIKHEFSVPNFDSIVKEKASFVGINKDKVNDVKELIEFLRPENQVLILNYLSKVGVKETKKKTVLKKQ